MLTFMSNLTKKKKKKKMHQLQTPGHRLPKMWPFFKVHLSKLSQNFYFYFLKKKTT